MSKLVVSVAIFSYTDRRKVLPAVNRFFVRDTQISRMIQLISSRIQALVWEEYFKHWDGFWAHCDGAYGNSFFAFTCNGTLTTRSATKLHRPAFLTKTLSHFLAIYKYCQGHGVRIAEKHFFTVNSLRRICSKRSI
jgi:hypothetical protein